MFRPNVAILLAVGCAVSALAVADQTTKYAYDALGRLRYLQVTGGPADGLVEYRYDASGNRTAYKVSGSTSSGSLTITPFTSPQTATGVVLGVRVGGFPPASGVVTFSEGGVTLGYAYVTSGEASVILEGFALGTHTVTASYSGDSFNAPYSHTFTIKVQNLSWLPAVLDLILSD